MISNIFAHLYSDPEEFFRYVAGDVTWTVLGTHPLAGTYHSKADFQQATTERLAALMQGNKLPLKLQHLHVDNDIAVAELSADTVSKKGISFHNKYCWVCRFSRNQIVEVRAYLDSVALNQVLQ